MKTRKVGGRGRAKRLIVEPVAACGDQHRGTHKPTDAVFLDVVDGEIVIRFPAGPDLHEKPLPSAGMADLSDVQELRVRLIREGRFGEHEGGSCLHLSRAVVAGTSLDDFETEVRRRFGPWPKARLDGKGRTVWSRHELAEMATPFANCVRDGTKTVIHSADR